VIRYGHGADEFDTDLAWRSRALWRRLEQQAGQELLIETGVLWLAREDDGWEAACERTLLEREIPVQRLDLQAVSSIYPSFDAQGLRFGLLEPAADVIHARRGVGTLVELAVARGARLLRGFARPAGNAVDVDGTRLSADRVIWACGPWLDRVFPALVELRVTRREYFNFAVGPGWGRDVPVFYDFQGPIYGLPDVEGHGWKVAPDSATKDFDPDTTDRRLSSVKEQEARDYLSARFPALADAPLVGGRVCQYELTADNEFVVAPHPEHPDVWLLGGGSGHGFKHGPALAEYVVGLLEGRHTALPRHALGPRQPSAGLRSAALDFEPDEVARAPQA